jgi:ATP-dependent protease HslVU (ClpYQ) peptidase subunit
MTAIVALELPGKVLLGADSCIIAEDGSRARDEDKLVRGPGWVLGLAGNGLSGDALETGRMPSYKGEPARKWLAGKFVRQFRRLLLNVGIKAQGVDTGICALVALRGAGLWCIDETLSVMQFREPWGAVGCGATYAQGALHAIQGHTFAPKERLTKALEAAAWYSDYVAPPWTWATI